MSNENVVGFAYLPDYDYEALASGITTLPSTAGLGIQMVLQVTDVGVTLLETSLTPPVLAYYVLGSSYGYSPTENQTGILGSEIHRGGLGTPTIDTGNFLLFSVDLGPSLGPFAYGEIGLFDADHNLIAVAVASDPIHKNPEVGITGGQQRIDLYLPMVGTNYPMWFAYAQQPNQLRLSVASQLDALPQGKGAITNAYVVRGESSEQSSFLAFSDRLGLWMFDAYQYGNKVKAAVLSSSLQTLVIDIADWDSQLTPSYYGKVILQYTFGPLLGVCRYAETATVSTDGLTVTIGLSSATTMLPNVGDTVEFLVRDPLSVNRQDLPIATETELGAIRVGPTLLADVTGVLDVRASALPVQSVNGQQGEVLLEALDIPGISNVGKTGAYADLTGKPSSYALPLATYTTVGGVRIGTSGALTVTSGILDFTGVPVRSVNTIVPDAGGNVALASAVGLVNSTPWVQDLNLCTTTGLYSVQPLLTNAPAGTAAGTLEVTPLPSGLKLQLWADGTNIFQRAQLPGINTWAAWVKIINSTDVGAATALTNGLVSVGAGINVDLTGKISLDLGVAGGIATLAGDGKVPAAQLPDAIVGALSYQGVWNAQTNDPVLVSGTGTKGWYYKVNVGADGALTTNLDGIVDWLVGDMVTFNGTTWDKISAAPDAVSSVVGRIGAIELFASDIQNLPPVALAGRFEDLYAAPTDVSFWVNDVGYVTSTSALTITGDATGVGDLTAVALTLADSGVAAGTYSKVVVDSKGRVTQGLITGSADVVSALGFTPYNASNPDGFVTATTAPVRSVFGRTGVVTMVSSDVTSALSFTPANKAGDTVGAWTVSGANYPFAVNSTNSYAIKMSLQDAGTARGYIGANASYSTLLYSNAGGNTVYVDNSGNLTAVGNVTAYSDRNLKDNIEAIPNGLDKVLSLTGVTWNWKKDGKAGVGLIAQEVQEVVPEAVQVMDDGIMSLAYGNLVGVLVEAIKDLNTKVENLQAEVRTLSQPLK